MARNYRDTLNTFKFLLEDLDYFVRIGEPDIRKIESYPLPAAFISNRGSDRNKLYAEIGDENLVITLFWQNVVDKFNEEATLDLDDKVDEIIGKIGFVCEVQGIPTAGVMQKTQGFKVLGFGRVLTTDIFFTVKTFRDKNARSR